MANLVHGDASAGTFITALPGVCPEQAWPAYEKLPWVDETGGSWRGW